MVIYVSKVLWREIYMSWDSSDLPVLWVQMWTLYCEYGPKFHLSQGTHTGLWLFQKFPRCAYKCVYCCQMLMQPLHFNKAAFGLCYICRSEFWGDGSHISFYCEVENDSSQLASGSLFPHLYHHHCHFWKEKKEYLPKQCSFRETVFFCFLPSPQQCLLSAGLSPTENTLMLRPFFRSCTPCLPPLLFGEVAKRQHLSGSCK